VERLNLGEQIASVEASVHAVTTQEEGLVKLAAALRSTLTGLSDNELRYTTLVREVDSARAMHAMLSEKLSQARIREQGEMKAVQVIDPPGPPTREDVGRRPFFLLAALAGAMVVGAGVPAVLEWRERRVETEEDVQFSTGLPVLAVVPRLQRTGRAVMTALDQEGASADTFLFAEGFRSLRAAVRLGAGRGSVRTLMISSALPAEGKSMTVANLGFVLAEAGYRVIIADTDFIRPSLTRRLNIKGSNLSDAVPTGTLENALTAVGDGLWVAGQTTALDAPARGRLATRGAEELVDTMSRRADIVIFDSSPVLVVQESLFLAAAVDGVVLIAKAGSTRCRDLARTKQILEGTGARVLGTILNYVPVSSLRNQYDTYAKANYAGAR
jgi:capsular exopolysaccharide synthesis family protein